MNTKDEALKLALDDLIAEYHMEKSSFAKRVDEIFKQALAAPVQEPFMWVCNSLGETEWETSQHQECEHCIPLYTTPPAAQPATEYSSAVAAPVQNAERGEPDHGDELTIAYMSGLHDGKKLTAKKPWVGLTDEQILAANYPYGEENGATIAAPDVELIAFAQAIEAKLKEKNGGAA
jgi:hypothetical protein